MHVSITAVGRDNWGLADPIVHAVTSVGAHLAEVLGYPSPQDAPPNPSARILGRHGQMRLIHHQEIGLRQLFQHNDS